jgi:biotin synthase
MTSMCVEKARPHLVDGFEPRHDWTLAEVSGLFDLPFNDLMFRAQSIHRTSFNPNQIQKSMLLSIKTGGCPEDCGYCSQSVHAKTGLEATKLMEVEAVLEDARRAKEAGASRYCMGAAWRNPKDRDLDALCEMVIGVKAMGLETCMTLGMLNETQAERLAKAGLDFYNHNLDTSPEFYPQIVSTRTYEERLATLDHVRRAGMNVCCGGIVGLGESRADRVGLLVTLAALQVHPESVPVNALVPIAGTEVGDYSLGQEAPTVDGIEFARTIAVARIIMPKSFVRLSAGREHMSDEVQALCFLAGANSIFIGDKLLTTENTGLDKDECLFRKLGLEPLEITRV